MIDAKDNKEVYGSILFLDDYLLLLRMILA